MGEGNPALVFYISAESLPPNKDVLRSAGGAETRSFLSRKLVARPNNAGRGRRAMSRFEDPVLSVPPESRVYSICDI